MNLLSPPGLCCWLGWFAIVPALAENLPLQGFGASTHGGEGQPVVEVTSLDDSGAGTLREALSGGNRRIEFRIAGSIQLKKVLKLEHPNVTLDGRSAPAPGITMLGMPLSIQDTHDVIVQHLRFRDSADDNLRIYGKCKNIVIDHCSSTKGGDGAIDITQGAQDITVSWCLLAGTNKTMLVNSVSDLSIHHNLFTNTGQRNPQLHEVTNFDVRNNVIRYWQVYGVRVRAGSSGNLINNVFGPSSNPKKPPDRALIIVAGSDKPEENAGAVYVQGNLFPGNLDMNRLSTAEKPFSVPDVTTLDAASLEMEILKEVGAHPRDSVDKEFLRASSSLQPRASTED